MAYTCVLTAASNAVAPAGGCVVFVSCMATIATEADSDPASHRKESKRACVGRRPKSLVMQRPSNALMKCPPMRARGCARGDSMTP